MATAPSPNDLTRQQLDELDVLLQKMLSVPISEPETPVPKMVPAPLPPSWRADPPARTAVPTPVALSLDDTPPPPMALKFDPAPPPKVAAPKRVAPMPVPPPQPKAAPTPVATAARPPVRFAFLPLVAINAIFDRMCGQLGTPGRVLRSGFCKHILGIVGLGLLATTAVRVAQVQGWIATTWPK